MTTRHIVADTVLGELTLVAGGGAMTGVYFRHHARRPAEAAFGERVAADPLLDEAARQIRAYLAGERRGFDLPLATAGDAVQEAVWAALRELPYGTTTTYGALAERLGFVTSAWGVGQAVGANPLCVLIPCHRVVGSNGTLTGYAGGLRRKRVLLDIEAAADGEPWLPGMGAA
ncbi:MULTISPECIES: methylated-DNA--[protein]-cysteine S-methyltransferase [Tsukamurella]|uniref:Methylated-DNA--protein-cysteine methyltransferase n=2 Tax=Tsukamurella TaxID=2060 RepID=A0A5C5S690_9ACTN|nr:MULTISPECIES: methylated-DNA--[protein]-cysteine S-methyltransferase [Tsukamurella]NMD55304.1 methylated-DNA--[protein]-cysteine S-methyltransferase [Tsukamurella columbiensis]TWS30729.1 methylated-DNA--[protein]-cysteine S-methyltransferase [Tsukamurella conjunctivitidis]